MKGQALAYNKDNQEDKEPVFDIVDTLLPTLAVMAELVGGGIEVDASRMRAAASEGFATATDLADYLVRKGLPFRDAHEAVAVAVRHAERERCDLAELPIDVLQRFSPLIERDVYAVLSLDGSVASRKHVGGTAPERVVEAIREARASLSPGK
jgi:argininosuccinate lyase